MVRDGEAVKIEGRIWRVPLLLDLPLPEPFCPHYAPPLPSFAPPIPTPSFMLHAFVDVWCSSGGHKHALALCPSTNFFTVFLKAVSAGRPVLTAHTIGVSAI